MRHGLASVILRLLGNRVVHEDADPSFAFSQSSLSKRESDSSTDAASAAFTDLSSESLFDELLLVLHGLLSSCQPSWLRSTKPTKEGGKGFGAFDRELAENLQVWSFSCFACYHFLRKNQFGEKRKKERETKVLQVVI